MTAPVLIYSSNSSTVEPLFAQRTQASMSHIAKRSRHSTFSDRPRSRAPLNLGEANHLWGRVLDLLPQGVIVVSRSLQPLYWNRKAKSLCQILTGNDCAGSPLPLAISEACYGIIRDPQAIHSSLMVECQASTGHLIRVSASLLEMANPNEIRQFSSTEASTKADFTLIAVFIENCDEVMQQESRIQQRKYDLTDREAEIWMLLRQEFTYQEIAQRLQISLNTVKTHVKNVYAKRRSGQGKEKFWY